MELQFLEVPLAAEGSGGHHSLKYTQMEELLGQVAMLPKELNRQHSIQEREQEINTWYCALSLPELCPKAVQGKGKSESSLELTDTRNSQGEGEWILVAGKGKRRTFPHLLKCSYITDTIFWGWGKKRM